MIIVDVREPDEFAQGHMPNAVSFPLSKIIADTPAFFEAHEGEELLVVCRSGVRSAQAIEYWVAHEYIAHDQAQNYEGGVLRWAHEGNEIVHPSLCQGESQT